MSDTPTHAMPHDDAPHNDAPDEHGPGHAHSIRPYVYVFIALLALLGAAVGVAYIPADADDHKLRFSLTFLAYTIAVVKGVLIILWFMHVKESSRLTWLFAGASFFFFVIMIGLMLNDYESRRMIAQPYRQATIAPSNNPPLEHRER